MFDTSTTELFKPGQLKKARDALLKEEVIAKE